MAANIPERFCWRAGLMLWNGMMLGDGEMALERLPAAQAADAGASATAATAAGFAVFVAAHPRAVYRVSYLVLRDAGTAEKVAQRPRPRRDAAAASPGALRAQARNTPAQAGSTVVAIPQKP